jgi:hypothetical protein
MNAGKCVEAVFETGSCTYNISPRSEVLSYLGGTVTVGITAKGSSYCPAPDISDQLSWIGFSSGFSMTRGTVNLTIPENNSSIRRIGTVTIGGQTVTVTQAGKPGRIK